MQSDQNKKAKRPPVVVIMGHIDHGKSTLLSYIRKSAMPVEAGGITQHISAYEVEHKTSEGSLERITFLDTPGHAAFTGHRDRGASAADIAVLVVAADDGVKPQTIEALNSINQQKLPFIVCFTKIDKPTANIDRAKTSLAEAGIYVEGFGGDVSWVAASGTTGEGIPELLDLIVLSADLHELSGDRSLAATGSILESSLDQKKGISATLIIKNGSLKKGQFITAGDALAPLRIIEDWTGTQLESASFSSPVRIVGWSKVPTIGVDFKTWMNKKDAEKEVEEQESRDKSQETKGKQKTNGSGIKKFPIILKADSGGSVEAVSREIMKIDHEKITPQIVITGIGNITENDVRQAEAGEKAVVLGFNVKVDTQAKVLAERNGITVLTFDIIYKLSEWLAEELVRHAPTEEIEEITGVAKVLKTFGKTKDRQVIGGRCEDGIFKVGAEVKLLRREANIARGHVRELQSQKLKISEIEAGKEFGAMVECKVEIMPGDHLHIVTLVRK